MAMIDTDITADTNTAEQIPASDQKITGGETKPVKAAKPLKNKTLTANVPALTQPKTKRSTTVAADDMKAKQKIGAGHQTKADIVLKKLCAAKGATIENLMEATGWRPHSVRGFLSAVVRKRLGLTLVSEVSKDGVRRYRIDGNTGTVA